MVLYYAISGLGSHKFADFVLLLHYCHTFVMLLHYCHTFVLLLRYCETVPFSKRVAEEKSNYQNRS